MVGGFSNRHPYDGGRDNKGLTEKVALRLHFIRKFHPENAHVFDCCQGAGSLPKTRCLRCDFLDYESSIHKHFRSAHHVPSARCEPTSNLCRWYIYACFADCNRISAWN